VGPGHSLEDAQNYVLKELSEQQMRRTKAEQLCHDAMHLHAEVLAAVTLARAGKAIESWLPFGDICLGKKLSGLKALRTLLRLFIRPYLWLERKYHERMEFVKSVQGKVFTPTNSMFDSRILRRNEIQDRATHSAIC
jgi:hypothetical protein